LAQGLALVAAAGDAEALGSALASAEAAGCPQAELEAAKAELKALRRRDCLAVVLRGATGPNASFINGTYSPTNEKANGAPVYVMVEDPRNCLYRATDGWWYAATVKDKDANECFGCASTVEAGLAHPTLAKEWEVADGKALTQQPVEASVMVSSRLAGKVEDG
jgi:hypothetical protein